MLAALAVLLPCLAVADSESLRLSVRAALAAQVDPNTPIVYNATAEWTQVPYEVSIAFAVLLLILGSIVILFGYRLLRLSAFIFGGFACAIVLFGACFPDD